MNLDTFSIPAFKQFRSWLRTYGGQAKLAKTIGVPRSTVYRWHEEISVPSSVYQQLIQDISRNSILVEDWFSDDEFKKAFSFNPKIVKKQERRLK